MRSNRDHKVRDKNGARPSKNPPKKISALDDLPPDIIATKLAQYVNSSALLGALGTDRQKAVSGHPLYYWRLAFERDFPIEFKQFQVNQSQQDTNQNQIYITDQYEKAVEAHYPKLDDTYRNLFLYIRRNDLAAIQSLHFSVEDLLIKWNKDFFDPISFAAYLDRTDILAYFYEKACKDIFLKEGGNDNKQDRNGFIQLSWAFLCCQTDAIKDLKKDNMLVNHKGNFNCTALYIAAQSGNLKAVRYLIENGANLNQVNKLGETPLWVAARNGHLEIVQYLLQNKANVDYTNGLNETPLYIAIGRGNFDVVQCLLKHGANVGLAKKFLLGLPSPTNKEQAKKIIALVKLYDQTLPLEERIIEFLGERQWHQKISSRAHRFFGKTRTPEEMLEENIKNTSSMSAALNHVVNYYENFPHKISKEQYCTIMSAIFNRDIEENNLEEGNDNSILLQPSASNLNS